jgi:hypothetical protein
MKKIILAFVLGLLPSIYYLYSLNFNSDLTFREQLATIEDRQVGEKFVVQIPIVCNDTSDVQDYITTNKFKEFTIGTNKDPETDQVSALTILYVHIPSSKYIIVTHLTNKISCVIEEGDEFDFLFRG